MISFYVVSSSQNKECLRHKELKLKVISGFSLSKRFQESHLAQFQFCQTGRLNFVISDCNMRNQAIIDYSALHSYSKAFILLFNRKNIRRKCEKWLTYLWTVGCHRMLYWEELKMLLLSWFYRHLMGDRSSQYHVRSHVIYSTLLSATYSIYCGKNSSFCKQKWKR